MTILEDFIREELGKNLVKSEKFLFTYRPFKLNEDEEKPTAVVDSFFTTSDLRTEEKYEGLVQKIDEMLLNKQFSKVVYDIKQDNALLIYVLMKKGFRVLSVMNGQRVLLDRGE